MSQENVAKLSCPPDDDDVNKCRDSQNVSPVQPPNLYAKNKIPSSTLRLAYQIKYKLCKKSVANLTEEESKYLQWAAEVLKEKQRQKVSANEAPTPSKIRKREHPNINSAGTCNSSMQCGDATEADSISMETRSKMIKLLDGTAHSPVTDNPRQVMVDAKVVLALLDRAIPDGCISAERWKLIKSKVTPMYQQNIEKPLPQYDTKGWHHRIKLIKCADKHSADLYRESIENIGEVWPGAQLELVPFNELNLNHTASAFIPAKNSSPKNILQLLIASNHHLPMDWYISSVNKCKFIGSRKMSLVLSYKMEKLLWTNKMTAYYGFGSIEIKFVKTELKDVNELDEDFEIENNLNLPNSVDTPDNGDDVSKNCCYLNKFSTGTVTRSLLEQIEDPAGSIKDCTDEILQQDESESEEQDPLLTKAEDDISIKKTSKEKTKVKPLVKLAVIDENAGITTERWIVIQSRLLILYWDILLKNPGLPPQCNDSSWHGGYIKIIKCLNERSANLYRQAFAKIGMPWPGAKLALVKFHDLPEQPLAFTHIYSKTTNPNIILEKLKSSNPNLPTHNWWIKYICEKLEKGGRRIALHINYESLEILRQIKGNAVYESSDIIISQSFEDIKNDCANEVGKKPSLRDNDHDEGIENKEDCNTSKSATKTEYSTIDKDEDLTANPNLEPSCTDYKKR